MKMSSEVDLNNCVNGTRTNLSESVTHGRTYVRCRHNQIVIKLLYQPNEIFYECICYVNEKHLNSHESLFLTISNGISFAFV